jgi:hypothetical protein
MDPQKVSCPTKTLLLAEWQKAFRVYSEAVAELARQIGMMAKADYERVEHVVKTARKNSRKVKADLEAHIAEHGCGNRKTDG